METLISRNLHKFSNPLLAPPIFPSNPKQFPAKGPAFFRLPFWNRKNPNFFSVSAYSDSSPSYWGGWEDLEPTDGTSTSAELDPFRYFLVSIGFHDKKDALLFGLGFLSALAVSRVKFSTMAIFPVSVLVFVAGLSVGVAHGDVFVGSLRSESKRQSDLIFSDVKQQFLVDFWNRLDTNLSGLKDALERAVHSNHVEMGDIKGYLDVTESVRLATLSAKKSMEETLDDECSNGAVSFDSEVEKKSNQKYGRKRKVAGMVGFDIVQFMGGLFQESLDDVKSTKAKDNIKREALEQPNSLDKDKADNAIQENSLTDQIKENTPDRAPTVNADDVKINSSPEAATDGRAKSSAVSSESFGESRQLTAKGANVEHTNEIPITNATPIISGKKLSSDSREDDKYTGVMIPFGKEHGNQNRNFHFTNKHRSLRTVVLQRKSHKRNTKTLRNKMEGFSDIGINFRTKKSEMHSLSESESLLQLHSTTKVQNKSSFNSHGRKDENLAVRKGISDGFVEGKSIEDQDASADKTSKLNLEADNKSLSSKVSDDGEFNRNMKEANELLKQAREYLRSEADEEMAEILLYKSTKLLSTAVALKPKSLLAVGQLGNTFLLHGELKLKISRELRTLSLRSDPVMIEKRLGLQLEGSSNLSLMKEKVASALVDVCEECEELLVEAGRQYRTALSIDESDIRALYNWGLALYFRAQLIADVGPEAAFDADKVYLAAIDKFAAMTSRSNTYAPDALFRWGAALQQRSRLRLPESKEKMKLLKQAKSLFEDALRVDSDNPLVREALFSCLSELNYNGQLN